MPKIAPQQAPPPHVKVTTPKIITQPLKTTEKRTGLKLCIYGVSGSGKNRFVNTFRTPGLLIGTEDGTKSLCTGMELKKELDCGARLYSLLLRSKSTGWDFVKLEKTEWLEDINSIILLEGYKTVCLDHAGGLQDLLVKEVLGLEEIPVSRSWGMTDRQTWGVVGMQLKQRISSLLDFADKHDIDVPIIAHERDFSKESDAESELVKPMINAALTPTSSNWLNAATDYICQTFKRAETKDEMIEVVAGGDKVPMRSKTGKIEWRVRVGAHEVYMTKFRLPPGTDLPDSIAPTYSEVVKLIRGE